MNKDEAVGPRRSRARLLVLIAVVLALDAGVFMVDLWLPPGQHEWLFYVAPVMLCLFSPRAWLPVVAAAVGTALLWFGLAYSVHGMLQDSVRENREIGGVLIWVLAGISTVAIASRNQIQLEHWLKQGHARLSEVMQSERDRRELARGVLLEICRRLGAQTGALFVSRDRGPYELAGGYAIDPERVAQGPAFQLGEGLVGQTARDQRVTRVSNVPAGYADLRSGLGAAAPRELVLAPLPANGGVEGVIELGFTGPAPALCEAYLKDVGELVGAAFRAVHYQEHLGELLETSRAQAVELQRRREDLQAINQELEQQSAALQTSQSELEEQRAELEQTNDELAKQAAALEHHQQELEGRNAELRSIRDELERKTTQLERASRYKSEFLANMSHELRTPLNSALILSRLLADNRHGNLTPEQVKYAETIHHAGTDLLSLINDVLDISKIEAGKMAIDPTRFTLAEVAAGIESAFSPLATAKGLAFEVSAVTGDAKLEADRGRLDQVLRNLVANAIKFTARGSVRVELSTEGDHVSFRIRDTGIGIPAEELERIFDAFHQAKIDGDRPEGTGLGLSIARRLATLMRGGITVESALGQGSTFTLRIPRAYADAPRSPRDALVAASRTAPPPVLGEPPAPASFTDDRGALDPARRTV
ncbi:MAG TPA: ATP-binding protein, partial [Kofleriaceae bacterium]